MHASHEQFHARFIMYKYNLSSLPYIIMLVNLIAFSIEAKITIFAETNLLILQVFRQKKTQVQLEDGFLL